MAQRRFRIPFILMRLKLEHPPLMKYITRFSVDLMA